MDAVLPGEDLIEAGLEDLRAGRDTIAALLVAIGSPRLRRALREVVELILLVLKIQRKSSRTEL